MTRTFAAVFSVLLWAGAPAAVQSLPHGVPDLCALDPACTIVAPGASSILRGNHTTIGIRGAVTVSGTLRAQTILCYPGGSITFADGSDTAFTGGPFHASDPEHWGHGLIAIDCRVRAQGHAKTPFVRTAVEPTGATFTLATIPSGWEIGDRVLIPDTRQLNGSERFDPSVQLQHEVRRIAANSGVLVTLDAPLSFPHRGARNADGSLTALRPHVFNLSRSITIRSENPGGTRGHLAFLGRADVDLRGVHFLNLGRTTIDPLRSASGSVPGANQIGRYPVHFHHLWGPVNPANTGYQYVFQGNVIESGLKWPLAIHNTHYGLVRGNVIYGDGNMTGAGIALEDGSETDNLIDGNGIVDIRGRVNPRNTLPGTADGTTPGAGGDCLWGAGFNNRIVNNVLTGCRNTVAEVASGAGIKLALPHAAAYTLRQPRFRGADMNDGNQTIEVWPQRQPILEMRGNEVYGLGGTGLTVWWLGNDGYSAPPPTESLVRDFTVWHLSDENGSVYWGYPSGGLTFDGVLHRVEFFDAFGGPCSFTAGDYRTMNLTVRNADIHAGCVTRGIVDPVGTFRWENIRATTPLHAFRFETPASPGNGASRKGLSIEHQIVGGSIQPWPGHALRTIEMAHDLTRWANTQPFELYRVRVGGYQGASQNFDVYFSVQDGSAQYYGGRAPCSTTLRPEIAGITCGSSAPIPPAPPPRPADSDGDGVGDADDRCPGTPAGTAVDAAGCPIVGAPPPTCTFDWSQVVSRMPVFAPVVLGQMMVPRLLMITLTDANGCQLVLR